MSKKDIYEHKTEELITPIIEENNFELVDVEYIKEGSNWILRAYIDKVGGITINDCELVNRALSEILDIEDFIEDSYILEVSSPGLGRQLKKDKDFERSLGEDVDIKLYKEIIISEDGKNIKSKEFAGRLDAYDADKLSIFIGEDTLEIPRSDIAMIRLSIDF